MMRPAVPCLVCERPAKPLRQKVKGGYRMAASEPLFCSVRCAADWALEYATRKGGRMP